MPVVLCSNVNPVNKNIYIFLLFQKSLCWQLFLLECDSSLEHRLQLLGWLASLRVC